MNLKFILVLIFLPIIIFSQTTKEKIDSLLTVVYPQVKFKVSTSEYIKKNENTISEAKKINYQKGIILGHINIANVLWLNAKYKESITYLDLALQIAESNKTDSDVFGRIYMEYAQVYSAMKLNDIALQNSDKAIGFFKKNHFKLQKEMLAYAYGSQAIYLFNLNKNDEALRKLHQSISYIPYPNELINIAYYYTDINYNKDSANYYLNFAENKLNKFNTKDLAELYRFRGNLDFKENKYKEAELFYLKSLSYNEKSKTRNLHLEYEVYDHLMKLYQYTKNPDKEKEYQEKSTAIKNALDTNINNVVSYSISNLIERNKDEKDKNLNKIYIIAAIFILVLLITGISIYVYYRKNRIIASKDNILNKVITETSELKEKLDESVDELIDLARKNDSAFLIKFEQRYPNFSQNLLSVNSALVKSEILFCALLTLNFSNKELAQYTFTLTKTIENRKTRIRKRLNIPLDENINLWIKRYL